MSSPPTRRARESARGAHTRNVRLKGSDTLVTEASMRPDAIVGSDPFGYEPESTERRQRDLRRERLAVPRERLGLDAAHVADVAAAVLTGVGVDQLLPAARSRQPDAVRAARDRRQ